LRSDGFLFVDKTRYIEVLDKGNDYYYLFLSPCQFGKSTFLDTLCTYYDIAESASFHDLFGELYIGKNPTKYRNSHLVLKLDLSKIVVTGDVDSTNESIYNLINSALESFLKKYHCFLGEGLESRKIVLESTADSLMEVFVSTS
jgi:hypothetical protein